MSSFNRKEKLIPDLLIFLLQSFKDPALKKDICDQHYNLIPVLFTDLVPVPLQRGADGDSTLLRAHFAHRPEHLDGGAVTMSAQSSVALYI